MSILIIEDALIARIKALVTNKVRTVDSLPADWDAETLKRLLRKTPGIFVSFGGGTPPQSRAGVTAQIQGRWGVFAVTSHASGEAARRRGDATQAGAYELMEIVVPGLHGYLVPNQGKLSLVAVENLYNDTIDKQGVTVYAAVFDMPMAWPSDADLTILAPFVTFQDVFDLAPKDGRTDAEDKVILPQ